MNKPIRKVKVLQINYSMNQGGAETWLVNLMRLIDSRLYDVDFLLHIDKPCVLCDSIITRGGNIYSCGTLKNPIRYSWKFIRTIKRHGPYHVVHSHSGILSALDILLARFAGVPIRIAHSRSEADDLGSSILWKFYRPIARWIIRHFATICIGVTRGALLSITGKSSNKELQSEVINSGVNLNRFQGGRSQLETRTSLSIPNDSPVIGHIGNFRTPKNHRFFVSIAQRVKKILPKSLFLLIGDGPLLDEIKTIVKMVNLQDSFIFAGRREDCPDLLLIMDCFLFPSLWEGFPQALVEAQAAGINCVISNKIKNDSVIIPSLVQKMDLNQSSSEWAKAVVKAVHTPSLNPDISISLIEKTHGDVSSSIKKLMKLYSKMLSHHMNREKEALLK